jgi:DNA repair protein RadC
MPIYKLKDIPKLERPREKLVKYGPQFLVNSELLESF